MAFGVLLTTSDWLVLTGAEFTSTPQKKKKKKKREEEEDDDDFHILQYSAYVYICYSVLKVKTYNWLPNTHTHTHQLQQKATGHVRSLANGHLTGSDAPFVCEIPTVSSEKKKARIINFNHFIYFIKKKEK